MLPTRRLRRLAPLLCLLPVVSMTACKGSESDAVSIVLHVGAKTAKIGTATIEVDYSRASASPVVKGAQPVCTYVEPGVTGSFSDNGRGKLTLQARSPNGFHLPSDLAVCQMIPAAPETSPKVIAKALRYSVTRAENLKGEAMDLAAASSAGPGRGSASAKGSGTGSRDGGELSPEQALIEKRAALAAEAAERAYQAKLAMAKEAASQQTAPTPNPARLGSIENPAPAGTAKGHANRPPPARPVAPEGRKGPAIAPRTANRPLMPARPSSGNPSSAGNPGSGATGDTGDSGNGNQSSGAGGGASEPDDYDDSDCENYPGYVVTIGSKVPSERLGALQFDVVHSGFSGCFPDVPGASPCQLVESGPLHQANYRGLGVASSAVISLTPFYVDGAFMECQFNSREAVSESNFYVNVVEAASVTSERLKNPDLVVLDVSPR